MFAAKQIAEEEEKYAKILAEGVRLDEELIAADEQLKGAQESLEEQEKISAEYFAGFQNVIDEINAAIAAAEVCFCISLDFHAYFSRINLNRLKLAVAQLAQMQVHHQKK